MASRPRGDFWNAVPGEARARTARSGCATGYSKTRIFRVLLLQHTAGGSAYLCACGPASHVLVSRSELEARSESF